MKMYFYTLPKSGHHFKGNAKSMNQLMAMFMNWSEKLGINSGEALAMWFSGSYDSYKDDQIPGGFGFISWQEINGLAARGLVKMPKETEMVELF